MIRTATSFSSLALLASLQGSARASTAVVLSPESRSAEVSTTGVALSGVASSAAGITVQVVNQSTGALSPLPAATVASSATPHPTSSGSYSAYSWSWSDGALAATYWAPQIFTNQAMVSGHGTFVNDLAASQGRLELYASSAGAYLDTFSPGAYSELTSSGDDPLTSGEAFSDGNSTVIVDTYGVGGTAESGWVNDQGMVSVSTNAAFANVAWSVGHYTVQGHTIYGLICAPTTGGSYPIVIYNHGGMFGTEYPTALTAPAGYTGPLDDGGDVSGNVTTSGWPSQPLGAPDGLGQCVDWAKRGWIVAMSSYRGQRVNITSSDSAFPAFTATSGGAPELCLGEVTDVLALTDLVVNHGSSIKVGSTTQKTPLSSNSKVLMYGYSHGGCVTYRAVEQGAPVTAFSVIEGFADFNLHYTDWTQLLAMTAAENAAASGAMLSDGSYYVPDANGVMGYNWRSPHYFASRGDLNLEKFKNMPILIFHGDRDVLNPVFLDQAVEMSKDISATNIFVGPAGLAPTEEPCVAGPVGAPSPKTATCPVSFTPMDTTDSCVDVTVKPNTAAPPLGECTYLPLPLTPAAGQPQQLHYLVVYHNMDHWNGGLAIKTTFDRFAEQNFMRQPGCDGLETDCATDSL